jgi:hypothetical protein
MAIEVERISEPQRAAVVPRLEKPFNTVPDVAGRNG